MSEEVLGLIITLPILIEVFGVIGCILLYYTVDEYWFEHQATVKDKIMLVFIPIFAITKNKATLFGKIMSIILDVILTPAHILVIIIMLIIVLFIKICVKGEKRNENLNN